MQVSELFVRVVIRTLEEAPDKKMTVANLRKAAQIRRGITSILQDMRLRHLVIFSSGELTMETEVSLSHG